MTEQEWLACDDPARMLLYLRGTVSEQERAESKLSLRGGGGTLFDGPSPIVSAMRFGRFIATSLARARRFPLGQDDVRFLDSCGEQHAEDWGTPLSAGHFSWYSAAAVSRAVAKDSIAITCAAASEEDWFEWGFAGGPPDPLYQATMSGEYHEQSKLLRDIVGNPFRPTALVAAHRTPTVSSLARAADDERIMPAGELDPDRLAVLSDALEEAGCDEEEILNHLRSPGPHVRGCWAVDLCLGLG